MLTARDTLSTEPLLSADEEIELGCAIEAGLLAQDARRGERFVAGATDDELAQLEALGELARQRFIRANLRLVAKAARQAAVRSRLPESDLFQEGCLGLICAVERFDCRRGYRFSTYASIWIRAYVSAATAGSLGALNLPASRAGQLRLARGVEAELTQSLGRAASTAEVATALGRTESWTTGLLAHQPPQSFDLMTVDTLDALAHAGGDVEERAADAPLSAELLWHLEVLEREVVALRFGFTDGTVHTYGDIGQRLSITASKARRVELRALEALRGVCPRAHSPTQ